MGREGDKKRSQAREATLHTLEQRGVEQTWARSCLSAMLSIAASSGFFRARAARCSSFAFPNYRTESRSSELEKGTTISSGIALKYAEKGAQTGKLCRV